MARNMDREKGLKFWNESKEKEELVKLVDNHPCITYSEYRKVLTPIISPGCFKNYASNNDNLPYVITLYKTFKALELEISDNFIINMIKYNHTNIDEKNLRDVRLLDLVKNATEKTLNLECVKVYGNKLEYIFGKNEDKKIEKKIKNSSFGPTIPDVLQPNKLIMKKEDIDIRKNSHILEIVPGPAPKMDMRGSHWQSPEGDVYTVAFFDINSVCYYSLVNLVTGASYNHPVTFDKFTIPKNFIRLWPETQVTVVF